MSCFKESFWMNKWFHVFWSPRACTWIPYVTTSGHLPWIQRQTMHGNIWEFLWGTSVRRHYIVCFVIQPNCVHISLFFAAVLLGMTCLKLVIPGILMFFRRSSHCRFCVWSWGWIRGFSTEMGEIGSFLYVYLAIWKARGWY